MVKKFQDYIKESNSSDELSYYALDWDDNILHMPTKILMDKKVGDEWEPVAVSTAEFATVRNDKENWRLRDDDPTKAFSEFRDFGSRGDNAFIEDAKAAISAGETGPSWDAFIKCLVDGSIFAIITARGHEPQSMRKGVEWIIDNILTKDEQYSLYNNCLRHAYIFGNETEYDRIPKGAVSQTPLIQDYLNSCDFYGVSSDSFAKQFGAASASNPEKAKEMALDTFIEKCKKFGESIGVPVSIGFSDDDPKNVEHVHTYFKEKSALANDLKLNLYKTTDRTKKGGERKRFLPGQEHPETFENNQSVNFDGLQSSVLPFNKWNNITQNLLQTSKDRPTDPYHNQFKNQVKSATEMTKQFAYKRKNKKSK